MCWNSDFFFFSVSVQSHTERETLNSSVRFLDRSIDSDI